MMHQPVSMKGQAPAIDFPLQLTTQSPGEASMVW